MNLENAYIVDVVRVGEIVINKGSIDGAEPNMLFLAFRQGKEIKDYYSSEYLGILEMPIALFRVINVQEKICYLSLVKTLTLTHSVDSINLTNVWHLIKIGDRVKCVAGSYLLTDKSAQ